MKVILIEYHSWSSQDTRRFTIGWLCIIFLVRKSRRSIEINTVAITTVVIKCTNYQSRIKRCTHWELLGVCQFETIRPTIYLHLMIVLKFLFWRSSLPPSHTFIYAEHRWQLNSFQKRNLSISQVNGASLMTGCHDRMLVANNFALLLCRGLELQ